MMAFALLGQLQLHRLDGFLRDFHDPVLASKPGRSNERLTCFDSYVQALMFPGHRKNMEAIARRVELDEHKVQHFITESDWNPQRVQQRVLEVMTRVASRDEGVIVFDDTGFPKQGHHSVGVQRQYSGTLGKVGNCQVGVAAVYAIPDAAYNPDIVTWVFGFELYVPEAWCTPEARNMGWIPEHLEFRTKPHIALDFLDRARLARLPHRAVVGDAGFGDDGTLRSELRRREETYVLGVNPSHLSTVPLHTPVRDSGRGHLMYDQGVVPLTPSAWAESLPKGAWKEVVWARGSKGPLRGRFARVRVRVVQPSRRQRATEETGWLLLEQRPRELKAYICWGFDHASLEELVGLAHARWVIEQDFHQLKDDLGLDHFQGRSWIGWHHHVTLVMVAFAYLAWLRAEHPGEHRPTLPEVRRAVIEWAAVKFFVEKRGWSEERAREEFLLLPPWMQGV